MQIEIRGTPPSLNKFAGRGNSWAYREDKRAWTEAVWAACKSCKDRPKTPYTFAEVDIHYVFPTRARHDADNYAGKFLLDGLTKAGVILDDDMAHIRVSVSGSYDRQNPRTIITVTGT